MSGVLFDGDEPVELLSGEMPLSIGHKAKFLARPGGEFEVVEV
jgi:hypothetical protein